MVMSKKTIFLLICALLIGCATPQTRRRRNIEELRYNELPTEFKNWLEQEGLDSYWYDDY
jgi:hypothetical protein